MSRLFYFLLLCRLTLATIATNRMWGTRRFWCFPTT